MPARAVDIGALRSARLSDVEHSGVDSPAELPARAFEVAPVSLSVSDTEGRIVHGNATFWRLFGHDPDRPLSVSDLSRDNDLLWTRSYLERLAAGDIDEYDSAKRFVRADGSEFDADVTIRAILEDGVCTGMVAIVRPVEVRPHIEDERVRTLLEHSASTLTLVDETGQVIETAGRYRSTLGYPVEFWEHRTILDVLVPEDVERVLALREEVLDRPGAEIVGDFRVVAADRRIETLEVSATNLLDDPSVRGIVVTSRNVTAERADRQAVAALHDDAVAESERRTSLLAMVSHELRNPLHAMSGMAELLASDRGLSPEQHELAVAIHRQLLRLADVTDDLLDTARLDLGEFRLRPQALDLRDLVDDVMRVAATDAGDRIDVGSTVTDAVPFTIEADPARLQQILGNLVGNAVKFTEHGSVHLTLDHRDGRLHIDVADTGPGVAADQLERVFEPFQTAPGSGGRRGAGLGLAVVRRLAEAMGGTATATSRPGAGSTFHVEMPIVEVDTRRPTAADELPGDVDPHHVLVVEDTPINQDLARAQLTRLGIACTIVGSAEDALELLAHQPFDAILMDHQLPGMNGRDATREIRASGWDVPVIGVTASSTAADERACIDAGMTGFLPKPVGLERLEAALASAWAGDVTRPTEPAPSVDPAHDAVDRSVLEQLVAELGDRSIVEQLVRSYLDELDGRSRDIGGPDADLAARQAHTLKSSSRLLGANALADLCAAAEHDERRRPETVDHAHAVHVALQSWLSEPAT